MAETQPNRPWPPYRGSADCGDATAPAVRNGVGATHRQTGAIPHLRRRPEPPFRAPTSGRNARSDHGSPARVYAPDQLRERPHVQTAKEHQR
jgi:hypothetical protein